MEAGKQQQASEPHPPPPRRIDEGSALRAIVEGTASQTGEAFFGALVRSLARSLSTRAAWVAEVLPERQRLRALAFWLDDQLVDRYEYDIAGTPCEIVINRACFVHHPDQVARLFPGDPDLVSFRAVSYMGAPLRTHEGNVMGNLAVLDSRPMPEDPRLLAMFQVFAARASAELQRLRAEARVRQREEQLDRLFHSVMDAIVQVDQQLCIRMVNPAAERTFRCRAIDMIGRSIGQWLLPDSQRKLALIIEHLGQQPPEQRRLWIPGGLKARDAAGGELPLEATLSHFELQNRSCHILVLRDTNDRAEAERQIRCLQAEAELLRQELRSLKGPTQLIGQSPPFMQMLHDIRQVAETHATVLIIGETGTGKELVARAIHEASARRDKPLVAVNCAAIPANLVESEFFGHEKGSFTGATARREGRFAMADGGTIFLDEIGELPLDLQAKLLRVLQEGQFEPVGSSQTRKADVRVLAATNRDLKQAAEQGAFRKDLFFRLNVFPIHVPPLRQRGQDIELLAAAFAQRFARKMGRAITPLSADDLRRLRAYDWPGNVRELENVIERAVITARDGCPTLDRALPELAPRPTPPAAQPDAPIHTADDLRRIERDNILRALESTQWRVAGERGAARLLGMPPSTLASRIKALGIRRAGD